MRKNSISRFSIRRWWQNFGFGIESKSDYTYLHEVLRESLPYYAYDDLLLRHPSATPQEHRIARLLFRMCNAERSKHIRLLGNYSELEKDAIETATGVDFNCQDRAKHIHNADIIIVKNILADNQEIWQSILNQRHVITFDMVCIGFALFDIKRYSEHYHISHP